MITRERLAALLVAGPILATATLAVAQSSPQLPHATPLDRAVAKAADGPDELRRFLFRTRMIYNVAYADVMKEVVVRGAPAAQRSVVVAQDTTRNDEAPAAPK